MKKILKKTIMKRINALLNDAKVVKLANDEKYLFILNIQNFTKEELNNIITKFLKPAVDEFLDKDKVIFAVGSAIADVTAIKE